jgi:hypothetical protein
MATAALAAGLACTPAMAAERAAPRKDQAERTLRRAERLFRETRRVRPGVHEATPVLTKLALSLPALHGTALKQARSLLARPTDGIADPNENGYTTGEAPPICVWPNVCVHYVTTTADAPSLTDANGNGTPDYVEQVGAGIEQVLAAEVGALGWRPPKSDLGSINNGGDGRVDVYLADVGSRGIYGYAAPDQLQFENSRYGYLVLDNDYSPAQFPYPNPDKPRQVTTAHEFGHLLMFNYDVAQDLWMAEATGTWFEEAVFPDVNDYLQYLPRWADSPEIPITAALNSKVYGDVAWNLWLAGRFGPQVIERSWAASLDTVPESLAPDAYDRGITAVGGQGMTDEFGRFAAAVAEWRTTGFADGPLFPDVRRAGALAPDGRSAQVELDHGSFALFEVPVAGRKVITLETLGPSNTWQSVALVGRSPGGSVTVQRSTALSYGAVTLANASSFSRVTAVVANTDFAVDGYSADVGDWLWSYDGAKIEADVIGRGQAPAVLLVSPRKQKRATVSRRGLLVSMESLADTPSTGTVTLDIPSRYLRGATTVGSRRRITLRPDRTTKVRVKLNSRARRALARRKSTPVVVKLTALDVTGTAKTRDSQRVTVAR